VVLGDLMVESNTQWERRRVGGAGEASFVEDVFDPGFALWAH
jgi:hypothetical protein